MLGNYRRIRWMLAGVVMALVGCAVEPAREAPAVPPIDTRVMAYPAHGQGPAQVDRDRYECHLWAVRESHFDPSAAGVPEAYRVHVEPQPAPGAATVVGAIAGAVLGAAVASPHNEEAGAVVGAVAGGIIGATAEQQRSEAARQTGESADRRAAQYGTAASGYRRAVSACLQGRGYTIS